MFVFVGGWFSDKYGRRKVMIYSAVALSITILVTEALIQKLGLDFR